MKVSHISKARRARSGGSELVELAFTLIPTLAFIFGLFDVGLMQFRWMTLQNAVREGCRYAVTFQTQSGLGQDASIKSIVQGNALGFANASDSPATIFVNYFAPSALNTAISCDTHTTGCSATGGNLPGNVVEVSVGVPFAWFAPLSGSISGSGNGLYSTGNFTITASSADVLGGYPVGVSSVTR